MLLKGVSPSLVIWRFQLVRALKVVGLGILLSVFMVVVLFAVTVIRTVRNPNAGGEQGYAIRLDAILFHPYTYLILLASFGLAYWLVRKTA
jgi:hypothetical protein